MRVAALALSALMSAWGSSATAADITLVASNAINVILDELVPQFERASGHKVTMRLGVASQLRKDIESGVAFDVAILVGNLDDLVKQGKVATGTPFALGRSGYGLAVRQGAPKPDIASTEAFRRALLNAKSIGYTEGGGSGAYFVRLLDRLGIADAMKPKLRPGTNMQAAVARGEVEMTVNGIVPDPAGARDRAGRAAAAGLAELQHLFHRRRRRNQSARRPRWPWSNSCRRRRQQRSSSGGASSRCL